MKHLLIALLLVATLRADPVPADQAKAYIVHYEGYRTTPYLDDTSYAVGIGHSLRGEHVESSYTAAQVERLFMEDLIVARRICRKGVRDFDSLPDDVQCVCLSLAWNVGPTGFMRFRHLRFALSKRAYSLAVAELRDSRWRVQTSRRRYTDAYETLLAHAQADR